MQFHCPGASSKNEKLKVGLYLRRCRPNEVSEADYAKAKQRNHNIIFEFLKHFCKFSFYDFHFIIPFGLGGLTSMIEMLRNHRIRIAELAMMISHLPKLKN